MYIEDTSDKFFQTKGRDKVIKLRGPVQITWISQAPIGAISLKQKETPP